LSGGMVLKGDHFEADGIPLTPLNDSMVWNPYQVVEVKVKAITKNGSKNSIPGAILATTRTTIPTSDEINCSKCHGSNPAADIFSKHDADNSTDLAHSQPVLCAKCHGTPILGEPGPKVKYLSQAIHGKHATTGAACYDCHPGNVTKCSRSLRHTAADGNCKACHGDLAQVANSIASGARIPWNNEPTCLHCHGNTVPQVDTGTILYRNAKGHGGMYCESCHGSPHAQIPTNVSSDSYTAIQYQGVAKTIGTCSVCHDTSKGNGSANFMEEHGTGGNLSACNVCHTGSQHTSTTMWPHGFIWKERL
jgi:hypothetical protein